MRDRQELERELNLQLCGERCAFAWMLSPASTTQTIVRRGQPIELKRYPMDHEILDLFAGELPTHFPWWDSLGSNDRNRYTRTYVESFGEALLKLTQHEAPDMVIESAAYLALLQSQRSTHMNAKDAALRFAHLWDAWQRHSDQGRAVADVFELEYEKELHELLKETR